MRPFRPSRVARGPGGLRDRGGDRGGHAGSRRLPRPGPPKRRKPAGMAITNAPASAQITVKVGPAKENTGIFPSPARMSSTVHLPVRPAGVKLNDKPLPGLDKKEEFDKAAEGWFFRRPGSPAACFTSRPNLALGRRFHDEDRPLMRSDRATQDHPGGHHPGRFFGLLRPLSQGKPAQELRRRIRLIIPAVFFFKKW